MTTFADLMSLLLTFFILLLSFANMDVVKFRDAAGSFKMAFGVQFDDTIKGLQKTTAASIVELSHITKDSVIDLELEARKAQSSIQSVVQARMRANENIYKRLQAIVRDLNLGDQVVVENTSKGVVITVNGQLFFKSGSAILRKESFPLLDSITSVIEEFPYKLNVEGHTDNALIRTSKFESNWELSAGRAISAVKYILSSGKIEAEKLGASGYAETRPIAQNDTPEGRRINRRIEFVFYKDDMDIKEFTDFQREEEGEEGLNAEDKKPVPAEGPLKAPAEGKATPLEVQKEGGKILDVAPAPKAPESEAVKKGILKPINILAPIGITPESVDTSQPEGQPPAPVTTETKPAPVKRAPAKAEPFMPGKFSAPTD